MLKAVTRCTEIKTRTCKKVNHGFIVNFNIELQKQVSVVNLVVLFKGHKNLPDQEEEAYDALQLRPKWWCFQKIKRSMFKLGGYFHSYFFTPWIDICRSFTLSGLYTCKVPKLPDVEKQCSCEGENKCYDITCENWMISVECPAECGKTCRNHRLGQGSTVTEFLLPYYTGSRGAGLKTTRNIREGELVIEYLGEILDDAEYRRRLSTTYKDYSAYYAFSLDKKLLIDSTIKGNFSKLCLCYCVTKKFFAALKTVSNNWTSIYIFQADLLTTHVIQTV